MLKTTGRKRLNWKRRSASTLPKRLRKPNSITETDDMKPTMVESRVHSLVVHEDGILRAHYIEDGKHKVSIVLSIQELGDKLYWRIT
jgi:hypothetical protein